MTIQQDVANLIKQAATAENPRPRIFVTKEQYIALLNEVTPKYQEQYGALMVDQKAFEEGQENLLFQGCAVCPIGESS